MQSLNFCPRRVLAQRPKPEEALQKPPRNREYVWYNQKKSRIAGAGAAKDLWVTYMIGSKTAKDLWVTFMIGEAS